MLVAEVLCLAALVPSWEHVMGRVAGRHPLGGERRLTDEQLAAGRLLASVLQGGGATLSLLPELPPPLLAEVCRESLAMARIVTQALREGTGPRQQEEEGAAGGAAPGGAAELRARHVRHLLKYKDHTSDFIRTNLMSEV